MPGGWAGGSPLGFLRDELLQPAGLWARRLRPVFPVHAARTHAHSVLPSQQALGRPAAQLRRRCSISHASPSPFPTPSHLAARPAACLPQTRPTAPAATAWLWRMLTHVPSAPSASSSSARSATRAGTRVRRQGRQPAPRGRARRAPSQPAAGARGRPLGARCTPHAPSCHPYCASLLPAPLPACTACPYCQYLHTPHTLPHTPMLTPAGTTCVSAETKLAMVRRKLAGGGRAAVDDLRRQEQELLSLAQIEAGWAALCVCVCVVHVCVRGGVCVCELRGWSLLAAVCGFGEALGGSSLGGSNRRPSPGPACRRRCPSGALGAAWPHRKQRGATRWPAAAAGPTGAARPRWRRGPRLPLPAWPAALAWLPHVCLPACMAWKACHVFISQSSICWRPHFAPMRLTPALPSAVCACLAPAPAPRLQVLAVRQGDRRLPPLPLGPVHPV